MVGADVQQVVDALGVQAVFDFEDLFGAFPFRVEILEAPGFVQSCRAFVETCPFAHCDGIGGAHGLVKLHLIVAAGAVVADAVADAGVHQGVRLVGFDHVVQLQTLRLADFVGGIAPDDAQISVFRQDFLELGFDLAFKALGEVFFVVIRKIPVVGPAHAHVGVSSVVAAAVGIVPVQLLRIVQPELQPMLITGFRQFRNHIPSEGGAFFDIPAVPGGIKEAEPVVMLTGDHHILHTCRFGRQHPFFRIEAHGVESTGQLFILCVGNPEFRLDPFADIVHPLAFPFPCRESVQAEVDHHTEFRCGEPFFIGHGVVLLLFLFFSV